MDAFIQKVVPDSPATVVRLPFGKLGIKPDNIPMLSGLVKNRFAARASAGLPSGAENRYHLIPLPTIFPGAKSV